MFRPRLRRRCLCGALLGSPALLWALLLVLAPTGWVRDRLVARLEAATGRSVRIGGVRLGITGHVRIDDLSLAERGAPGDPWLLVREVRVDLHPGQVLLGRCTPGDVEAIGVDVRAWRRADGRLEFGDLVRQSAPAGPAPVASSCPVDLIPAVNFRVAEGAVHVVDEVTDFRADLTQVEAAGSCTPTAVQVDDLRGQLNGGTLRVAARLTRDPAAPEFRVEVRGQKVRLDRGLELVASLVPLVARPDDAIGGVLNVRLALRGRGASCGEVRRTLAGDGSILLDPVALDGSRILAELRRLGDWPEADHVGSVSSNFVVGGGRVSTDDLTIRASKVPLIVAGWADFDGRFDYAAEVGKMTANLPREARAALGELNINLDDLAGLRIFGEGGRLHLTLHGRPLVDDDGPPTAEQARLRATARKIRDRIFR